MENVWKDIRFGFRTLIRNPATTLVAMLTLALGIGANSAIFSVVNGVLLEPLPYPQPDELVRVWESAPKLGFPRFSVAPPNFADWRKESQSFEYLVAFGRERLNLTGGDQPEVLQGASVTSDFFRMLGAEPRIGRGFTQEEGRPGQGRAAVLSHGLWQRRFGADPKIVGRPLNLNGESYVVVGIAPSGFELPRETELWVPMALDFATENRGAHYLGTIGRLKDGVSLEKAQAEMTSIASRLAKQYPDSNSEWTVSLMRLRDSMVEDIRPALVILLVAVSFVLLIACANVANLLLARVASRERELAVRAALGASRTRLVRQMLTETVILFVAGGALGLLFAWWGVGALVALDPDGIPRAREIGMDGKVLAFTFLVSLVTGLLFGLVPALSATGRRLYEALKEGGRAMAGGAHGRMVRNLLVLGEVAVALVLLMGAGLLIQSFARLSGVDPGFRPEGLLTARITIPEFKYPDEERQAIFYRQLEERISVIPGVEQAAIIYPLPLSGANMILAYSVEGRPAPPPSEVRGANVRMVSPAYFRAMGIPVVRGRAFREQDGGDGEQVVIINQAMAAQEWPDEEPLGKRFTFGDPADPEDPGWRTIVGVVGDVRHDSLDQELAAEAYWPQSQGPSPESFLVLRTSGDPASLTSSLREAVRELDRDLPIDRVQTMESVVAEALAQNRFKTLLLGLFAGLALVLAAVGVYGVVSYSVAQRTHEIGIRMALGARPDQVRRLVVFQGMRMVLIGAVVGLALALFATRFLRDQVYGVSATDPVTFAVVPLVLIGVALLANWLPALRATRVDPLEALRYE
ncbi:MAG TPA: ABC transporter permease [Thermoanaerobaculia bacterium]|nr:ABC transporter permease [Thermoanaerobaculia bacterium]